MKLAIDRNAKARARALFARRLARGGSGGLETAPLVAAERTSRRVALWLLWLATGAFLAAGILLVLGFTGAVNLDRFAPSVEAGLSKNLFHGEAVSLGAMRLKREGWSVAVSFADLAVHDSAGRTVLTAPRGAVGVDMLALATGTVKVKRVELDALDVKIQRRPDGAFAIAGASAEGADEAVAAGAGLAGALAAFNDLDAIVLRDAKIAFVWDGAAKTLRYEGADLTLERSGADLFFSASAKGPAGPFSSTGSVRAGTVSRVAFAVKDFAVADVLAFAPPDFPFDYDAPLQAAGEGDFGAAGDPAAFKLRFMLGAGRLSERGGDRLSAVVDEAGGEALWDAVNKRYRLQNLRAQADENRFAFSGNLSPPNGGEALWRLDLASDAVTLAPGKSGEAALSARVALNGDFDPASGALRIGALNVQSPNASGALTMESRPDGDGRALKATLTLAKSAAAELIRLWPRALLKDVRDWSRERILGGTVESGTVSIDLDAAGLDAIAHNRAAPADAVHGALKASNLAIQAFAPGAGIPAFSLPQATLNFNGRVLNAGGPVANLDLSATRKIKLADISFSLPDTAPANRVPARLAARAQASADSLADLATREPFRSFLGAALDPAGVRGQFDGAMMLDFPLGPDVTPQEFKATGSGVLSAFTLDKALGPQKFENATLNLTLDPAQFKLAGQGTFLGGTATLEAVKGGKDPGTATFGFTLDAAARKRLGFIAPGVDGPMGVKIKAPWTRAGADVELDLAKLAIEDPIVGPLKAAGKPGRATFSVKQGDQGFALQNIAIDAGGLSAKGAAQIDAAGALVNLRLSPLKLPGSDAMSVEVAADQSPVKVSIKGGQVDAKPIIQNFLQKAAGAAKPGPDGDVEVDAQFSAALGAKGQALSQVTVTASRRGGAIKKIAFQAKLGLGTVTFDRDEAGVSRIHVGDSGALLRYLDLYAKMEGGLFDATVREAGGAETGDVQMRSFTLRSEPAIRQLASASQPANAAKNGAPFDPDVVSFDRLRANFRRSNGRVEITDAVVYNPVLGITTQGTVDFTQKALDLSGAFIPAYQLNSLVGRIPILGLLLSGGKNEGIFSVNYRVSGAFDKSTLTIDPLSAAAPGILRKILGAIDGTNRPDPLPSAAAPAQ